MSDPELEIIRLNDELAAERERVEAATHYATQITVWTVETFFEPDKTGWKPLTELLGVLSQLDNALVGVREKRDKLRESILKIKKCLTYEQLTEHRGLRDALVIIEDALKETK
jgi:hypothetical protein